MLAALVVSSDELYQQGLSGLSQRGQNLLRREANELGMNAYYDFVTAKLGAPPTGN
jgi:hypothetical protein